MITKILGAAAFLLIVTAARKRFADKRARVLLDAVLRERGLELVVCQREGLAGPGRSIVFAFTADDADGNEHSGFAHVYSSGGVDVNLMERTDPSQGSAQQRNPVE